MRILHAVHNLPPEFVGGTEAYVAALCGAQRRRGHEVAVVCGSERPGPEIAEEELDGVPVRRLHHDPEAERYSVHFEYDRLRPLFRRVIDGFQPDRVHVHHYLNLGIPMAQDAVDAGVPAAVTLHDFTSVCPRFFLIRPDGFFCGDDTPVPRSRCVACCGGEFAGSALALEAELEQRRAFYAAELTAADPVLVPSARAGEIARATGLLPDVPLRVVPLGLLRPLSPVARQADAAGRLRLVFFGNIAPVKGVETLLHAVASLPASRRERVSLTLLGAATDPELDARIDAFRDRVRWIREPGYDAARLARLPAEADVAVFPGAAAETYSLVVDEALALSLPLILSDRGAAAERAGDAAIVVPTGDVAALAGAIDALLDDPARLDTLRAAAAGRSFTIDDHAAALDALYRGARTGA